MFLIFIKSFFFAFRIYAQLLSWRHLSSVSSKRDYGAEFQFSVLMCVLPLQKAQGPSLAVAH